MMILEVLSPEELSTLHAILVRGSWLDGKTTAGPRAARVKHNLQLDSTCAKEAGAVVDRALARNGAFMKNIFPVGIIPPLFSRYTEGMEYGTHVDNAVAPGGLRLDVAVTVFLSDPDSFDGGGLQVEGQEPIKLAAGSAVVYPANTLHSVAPVTRGERLAAVTWAQSRIRDPAQRQLLMDLGMVYAHLRVSQPDEPATDLALKTYSNLSRMWLD
jgi:PKHD-type hydroxylase